MASSLSVAENVSMAKELAVTGYNLGDVVSSGFQIVQSAVTGISVFSGTMTTGDIVSSVK